MIMNETLIMQAKTHSIQVPQVAWLLWISVLQHIYQNFFEQMLLIITSRIFVDVAADIFFTQTIRTEDEEQD